MTSTADPFAAYAVDEPPPPQGQDADPFAAYAIETRPTSAPSTPDPDPGPTVLVPLVHDPAQDAEVAAREEEDRATKNETVRDWFEKAQVGNPSHELEAFDLHRATGVDVGLVRDRIDDFRKSIKAAGNDPAKWRQDNPELYYLLTQQPAMGPVVIKDHSIWRKVVDESYQPSPSDAMAYVGLIDPLDPVGSARSVDELVGKTKTVVETSDQSTVATDPETWGVTGPANDPSAPVGSSKNRGRIGRENLKIIDPVVMQDLSHLNFIQAGADAARRTKLQNAASRQGWELSLLEMTGNGDGAAAHSLRNAIDENLETAGLPAYYGSRLARGTATATEAVAGGASSMVALASGIGIGAILRRPDIGLMITKIAGGSTSYVLETGGAYNDLSHATDDQGNPIDKRLVLAGSHLYGLLAMGAEVASLGVEAKGVAALDAKAWIKQTLADKTKRGALLDLAKGITKALGKDGLSEGTEGGAQQAMQLAISWLTKSLSAGEAQSYDIDAAVRETGDAAAMEGLGGVLGVGSVTGIAKLGTHAAQQLRDIDAAHRAGAKVAAFNEVAKTDAAKAAPQQVADFIASRQQADGRKVTHLYVDPRRLVEEATLGGASQQEVATELMGPDGPQRLQDALDLSGDAPGARATLEVPLAEYLEKWGGKPIADALAEDVSTGPGLQTMRELRLFQRAVDATKIEDIGGEEGVAFVGSIEEQLVAAGRPEREAKLAAEKVYRMAANLARESGRKVEDVASEMFQIAGVGIEKPKRPTVTSTTAGPAKKQRFKNAAHAFTHLEGDFTEDAASFDAVNEQLELRGDKKVATTKDAFAAIYNRTDGSSVDKARAAVDFLSKIPGLEGMRLPDEIVAEEIAQRQHEELDTQRAQALADEGDASFNFGANVETLKQPSRQRALIEAAHAKLTEETAKARAYLTDTSTGLLNERGLEDAPQDPARPVLAEFEVPAKFINRASQGALDGVYRAMAGALRGADIKDGAKVGGSIRAYVRDKGHARDIAMAMQKAIGDDRFRVTYAAVPVAGMDHKAIGEALGAEHQSVKARLGAAGEIGSRKGIPPAFARPGDPAIAWDDSLKGASPNSPEARAIMSRAVGETADFAARMQQVPTDQQHADLAPAHIERFRRDVAQDPEAVFSHTYYDDAGLLNDAGRRAVRQEGTPVITSDVDFFREMNDAFGKEQVNAINWAFGKALRIAAKRRGLDLDIWHPHGDEYGAQGADEKALEEVFEDAKKEVARYVFIGRDPKTGDISIQEGLSFEHATDPGNLDKAEGRLDEAKSEAKYRAEQGQGERAGRPPKRIGPPTAENLRRVDELDREARDRGGTVFGLDRLTSRWNAAKTRAAASRESSRESSSPADQVADAAVERLLQGPRYNAAAPIERRDSLDLAKTMHEQPHAVLTRLAEAGFLSGKGRTQETGQQLLDAMAKRLGGEAAAVDALQAAGVRLRGATRPDSAVERLYQGGATGDALSAAVDKVEDEIRNLPHERIHVIAPDGSVLATNNGNSSSCEVPADAAKQMRERGDTVFTHNHPSGRSLSVDDIHLAMALNVAEMRATTPDGGTWILRRPAKGWGLPSQSAADSMPKMLQGAYNKAIDVARARMDARVSAAGGEPGSTTSKGYSDEAWNQFQNEETVRQFNDLLAVWFDGTQIEHESPASRRGRISAGRVGGDRRQGAGVRGEQLRLLQNDDDASPRGWIDIIRKGGRRQFRIFLTKKADASTLLHESAHAYFEMLGDLAEAPGASERLKQDWTTARKWVGAEDGKPLTEEQKEKLARGFEVYLLEGRAPSSALAEAFASFRRWLFDIYKSIKALGIELDDNIRGVFDRMLATEQEIERARSAAGLAQPVFSTPEQAGVDPKDFDAYLAAQERIRSDVIARTQRMIYEGELRAAKAYKTDEFKKFKQQFADEYDQLPQVKAWRYLRLGEIVLPSGDIDRNTGRGKLDRDEVIELLGADHPLIKKLTGRLAKNGESPIDVAEQFGFQSGAKDMLETIARLPERDAWVKSEAERAMKDKHPEIEGEIADLQGAIQRLQHADSYDQAERDWQMIKARTSDQLTLEALQASAKAKVAAQPAGRLDPNATLNRERAFATKMAQAVAEGNFDLAMVYAHKRLLHKYMWQELVAAKDMREKFVDLAGDMLSDKRRAELGLAGPEYRDVTDTLLEAIGATPEREQDEPRKDLGALIGRMALDGNGVAFDPLFIGELLRKPKKWRDLKVSELRSVLDALQNIKAAARNITKLTIGERQLEREKFIEDLVASAEANVKDTRPGLSSPQAGDAVDAVMNIGADFDGKLTRPETMLEHLGGDDIDSPWHWLVKLIQDAKHKNSDLLAKTIKPISDLFDDIPRSVRGKQRDRVDGRALFPGHRTDIPVPSRRFELLMLALNAGNASNLERLLEGRGITPDQLRAAMSLLTKEELEWVQAVWDQVESLWPLVRALEERDTGVAPDKIAAVPMTITTSDGKQVTLRGGYFPAVYDNRTGVGEKGDLQNSASAIDVMRPGTSRSHTKQRAAKFSEAISLNPTIVQSHIVRVVNDLSYREAIRSAAGIFLHPRMKELLRRKLGEQRAGYFEPWLRDIGRQNATRLTATENAFQHFRSSVPVAVLGYAVDNFVGDTTAALTVAIGSGLSKQHYAAAIAESAASPNKTRAFVLEKSGELRSRAGNEDTYAGFSRRMKSLTKTRVGQVEGVVREHAFWLAQKIENTIVTPVWLGTYRQALADGRDDATAVDFADSLVRRTFPSKDVVDKSSIQRDRGLLGGLSMFIGYGNLVYNQDRRLWQQVTRAEGLPNTALAVTSLLMQHLALAAVVGPLAELFVGRGPDPGEEWEKWFLRKLLIAHLMPFPVVGGIVEGWLFGKQSSSRTAPGLAIFEQLGRLIQKASKDDADPMDVIIELMKVYGYAKGLPAVRPTRWLQYLLEGEYDNPGGVPAGLLYGDRKNQPENIPSLLE